MKSLFLIIIKGLFLVRLTSGQSVDYSGTYVNDSYTIYLQFKMVENEYHGLLQTAAGNFAMRGTIENQQLKGSIFAVDRQVEFTAQWQNNSLNFNAYGYAEYYQMVTPEHTLHDFDLTPYFQEQADNQQLPQQPPLPSAENEDYDNSYSQHNGQATEKRQTFPEKRPQTDSDHPTLNDPELQNLIAGSQLVFYTRTSIFNDNTASSITYVNFCANGTFSVNYDGSFSVEGDYGGNAQGAAYGKNSGNWQLVNVQGQPAVFLSYYNGNTSVNPVVKQNLIDGRWKVGNTQYAIQRNKVRCN